MARLLDVEQDLLELLDGLRRHHELVLTETRRAVSTVPFPEHVERVIKLRQVLHLAAIGSRLAVPQLAHLQEREERRVAGQDAQVTVGARDFDLA